MKDREREYIRKLDIRFRIKRRYSKIAGALDPGTWASFSFIFGSTATHLGFEKTVSKIAGGAGIASAFMAEKSAKIIAEQSRRDGYRTGRSDELNDRPDRYDQDSENF